MKKAMSRFVIRKDSCKEDKSPENKSMDHGSTHRNRDGSTVPEQDGEIDEVDFPSSNFQRSIIRTQSKLESENSCSPNVNQNMPE